MMGICAADVDRMTLWQITSQAEAYADANTPAKDRKMSVDEFEELSAFVDEG